MSDTTSTHEPRTTRGLLQHYLGDLVYGANDGIITTFAVVSGVTGAALSSRIILILGFANLLADGFSMGASNYLAIRSDEAARGAAGKESVEPFALRHGLATFLAFLVAGMVPLLAYLVTGPIADDTFRTAVTLTLLALFAVGASRSLITGGSWWRSGGEMLLVGGAAALVAYGVGALVAGITDRGGV
jgi:VIT1/CCC1 family predicted Fe2+/Mn2+ transporter